jgi:hypothetical protein
LLAISVLWFLLVVFRRRWCSLWIPVFVGLVGAGVIVSLSVYTRIVDDVDLGPSEKVVDGELHLTLTGWDQGGCGFLQHRLQAVVLQMANPDVSDATLSFCGAWLTCENWI